MTAEMSKYTSNSPLHSPIKDTATSECITRTATPSKHRDSTDHLQANLHGALCTQPLDSHSPSLLTERSPSLPGVLIPTHEQVQNLLVPCANKSHLQSSGRTGWLGARALKDRQTVTSLGFRDSEDSKTLAWQELQLQGHEDTWTKPQYLTQAAMLS